MTDTQSHSRNTARSESLFERAREIIPGGVHSPVRAFAAVGGVPRFMDRGSGANIWDVDGNRYLDFVMSWGPLIHGHAYGPVVEAVRNAAARGTSFGAPTEGEVVLASIITGALPSVEMVRFVSSGTEAAMSAIRLARGYTGRDLIVKFAGNYHGHADALLAQAGSGSLTLGVPTSPGVPESAAHSTLVATYNDIAGLEALFGEYSESIACVIVEPIAGNMGVVSPKPGFLETVARLCTESGALFICDEVITGFRVAAGGAQGLYDLRPDLTVLGKIVGGGLPMAAYGGRRDVMELVAPVGPVYQAGTLSGNPLAMAAGIASLEPLLDGDVYAELGRRTGLLADGLRAAAAEAGVTVTVNAETGMLTMFFAAGPVETLADAQTSDVEMYGQFFHAMLERGIYLPPSQFEAWMVSLAHGDDEIERTVEAAKNAFEALSPLHS